MCRHGAFGGRVEAPRLRWQKAIRCSAPTGRAILETLDKLQLGSFENPGPPVEAHFLLADRFKWLLEPLKAT